MQAMSNIAPIPLVPEQCAVLRHCKDAFCKAVEAKFGCTAIFHNLKDSDSSGSDTSKLSVPEVRFFKQLSSGVKVSVCKEDLTRVKVDAVVNAANEKLMHVGGLALALSEAGGPIIQQASNDIIYNIGRVQTGTAVVTTSGNLPCKRIIHAVGPCLSANPPKREVEQSVSILHKTIFSILEIVEREQFSSVAIPALSSGLFNFPRDICANIIVNSIKQHNDVNAFRGRPVEINLINNDDPTVQEMERACVEFLGPSIIPSSYSGAVKGANQSTSFSPGNSLRYGNITLHLSKGHIEEQKVDVIVNTIAGDLELNVGEISKAILNKAGKTIQEEIKRKKRSFASSGDIFVTAGHFLKCKEVYHTVCPSSAEPGAAKVLYRVVLDCLSKTVHSPHKSIAFPAIGTGNLHFHKYEVAQIMMDAVADFANQNSSKNLDINFVVFPKDNEMMKAFERKLNSMKKDMKSSELSKDMMQSSSFATKEPTRNETPTLEISSVSNEAAKEAKAWTLQMLNPQIPKITIMNNHVIYLGQKDHENLMSLQTKFDVKIQVFFRSGNGGITITGEPISVKCATIEVESMLCKAQEDFTLEEESDLLYSVVRWHCQDPLLSPKTSAALEKAFLARNEEVVLRQCLLNNSGEMSFQEIRVNINNYLLDTNGKKSKVERTCLFKDYNPFPLASKSFYARTGIQSLEIEKELKLCGLSIIKVEKIENAALQQIFELNRKRMKDKPEHLYQCVSAQFCDLICRVGFHKDFAPPAEQRHGRGIYFSRTLEGALKLGNGQKEEYIYIIQAKVLTGKSTIGSPDLILPPAIDSKALKRYDSVNDNRNTHVIFSGQQALPEYLIVCKGK